MPLKINRAKKPETGPAEKEPERKKDSLGRPASPGRPVIKAKDPKKVAAALDAADAAKAPKRKTLTKAERAQLNKEEKGLEGQFKDLANKSDAELAQDSQMAAALGEVVGEEDFLYTERLVLMQRMRNRGLSASEIMHGLGIGRSEYQKMERDLSQRVRVDLQKVDIPSLLGNTLTVFEEVRGQALLFMSDAKKKELTRIAAMGLALKAESDKMNLLIKLGMFDKSMLAGYTDYHVQSEAKVETAPTAERLIGKILNRAEQLLDSQDEETD